MKGQLSDEETVSEEKEENIQEETTYNVSYKQVLNMFEQLKLFFECSCSYNQYDVDHLNAIKTRLRDIKEERIQQSTLDNYFNK